MVMAPKAEIPLYHQNRPSRLASSKRRKTSGAKRRNGSGNCCSLWSVMIVSSLVVVAFCFGTFLGMELAQAPGGVGTGLHTGNSAPGSKYMPHGAGGGAWNKNSNAVSPGAGAGSGGEGWDNSDNNIPAIPPRHPPPQAFEPEEQGRVKPVGGGPGEFPIMSGGGGVGSGAAISGAGDGGVGGGRGVGVVGGGTVPWLQQHSFQAREGAYVSLKESLDTSQEVTATAWIMVEREMADIKTVLGNKMSGCGSDALGFALYVNEWNKKDGQLWLEWGDGAKGCQKIHSKEKVPVGRWVHVGARMDSSSGKVSIFMDGYVVAFEDGSRRPGSREDFSIGAFSNGDFPFEGRIGAVAVFGAAIDDRQIAEMAVRSAATPIGDVLDGPTLSAERSSLLVALQLDEVAEKEQERDGAVARSALGAGSTAMGSVDGVYHFMHMQETPQVDANLKDGISTTLVTVEMKAESDRLGRERAAKVKEAMQHAWKGYETYAFGADELAPRGKKAKQPWGGMGVTLVDSLDTLWLMDMKDEFWRARDWVRDKLTYSHAAKVSVFETTIRELGGLLSAYDLSGDEIFKRKAMELGDLLLPAFDTKTGIPTAQVDFKSGRNSGGTKSVLAEIGTLQVEFRYLSKITGLPKYADKANKVFDIFYEDVKSSDGLFPVFINPTTAKPIGNQFTFGALGDSFYEYLLKTWLQGGKTEPHLRIMYDRAMDGMTRNLLQKSHPSGLTYVSDWDGHAHNTPKMDHLVCFLAGTLALGAVTSEDANIRDRDMKTAKALAYTCYQMYARQKTGLAPEVVNFINGKDMVVPPKAAYNILRPETAEALYVLHRITGDPIYREWSWEIFQAFDKYCRLPVAFGSYPNVNDLRAQPDDRMESFFLAETLKYLYLIQDPDQEVDLEKYVFNTEAHPLRVFESTQGQPSFNSNLRGNARSDQQ